ncbi:hypothetical protein NPX13_g9577 [Xylaria arbuscula]|uniref:Uncharacterized protein n=1 Tax=Xylaria arbuscula TaxID=114810 RepID=A0A9W8N6F7_9PEZI|nr:hypothetical protein NPX13_g9577 [Xylaria arbuscula]
MTITTPYKAQRWTALRTPEVERLTPDRLIDKHRSSSESLDSNTTQNVVSLLRLPVALTELLNVPSELVDTETLSLFLSRRSLSDRYQLLDVLEKLYQCCGNLCLDHQKTPRSTPTPLPQSGNEPEQRVEAQPEYSREAQRVYSESNSIAAGGDDQPEDELENDFIDDTPSPIEFEENTSNSNAEVSYENLEQNELGGQDFINPITIRKKWDSPEYEIDSMFKCAPSAASSSSSRTGSSAQSDLARETIENPSTSKDLPVVQLRTPLKTPLKRHDIVPPKDSLTKSYDQPIELMIAQTATEFARSSLEEIEQLQFPIDSAETYKNLFHSLKATSQAQATWSSGSEWRSIVESGLPNGIKALSGTP